jgi:hypothetical protein
MSSVEENEMTTTQMGGKKKSNGHKANCMCPICKNMMKKNKKTKRGGDIEDGKVDNEEQMEENTERDIEANNEIKKDVEISNETYDFDNQTEMDIKDTAKLDAAEKGELGLESIGGTRKMKHRSRKSHKGRKTRKTRKTRKHRKRSNKSKKH